MIKPMTKPLTKKYMYYKKLFKNQNEVGTMCQEKSDLKKYGAEKEFQHPKFTISQFIILLSAQLSFNYLLCFKKTKLSSDLSPRFERSLVAKFPVVEKQRSASTETTGMPFKAS